MPPLAAPPGVGNDLAFWPFWALAGGAMRVWLRLAAEGPPPPAGACVLVANHTSFLDPLLLGAVVRRRIVFLMTEVVYRAPALHWFCRWNRAIPLRARGGNREALRAARAVLQQGRWLAVFPEGGISRDGLPLLGNPGAVSLVLQEGVPIVPVGIVGAAAALPPGAVWPRPRRVRARFGAPIPPAELGAGAGDRRGRLQTATDHIMDHIAALCGQQSRAAELRQLRSPAG